MRVEVLGRSVPGFDRESIRQFVAKCYGRLEHLDATGAHRHTDLTVSIISDRAMKELNRTWRDRDATTDILTFSADEVSPDGQFRPLGDLAISYPQARRQSVEEGHSIAEEFRYLILHGLIHALGWDHETDEGEMNALELKARKLVGL